ncbi:WD40 repeat domain-containing protein [Treponema sp. R6D11]
MAQKKSTAKVFIIILIFIVYFLIAARPIPRETVLSHRWIRSLSANSQTSYAQDETALSDSVVNASVLSDTLLPFTLGSRFGYVDAQGQFAVNRSKISDIYLSPNMWTEYGAEPANIVINNILNDKQTNIENTRGYPVLLGDRIFILGSEQNSLSQISENGNVLWTYEFGAPLTCIDATSETVVTGSLDGAVEVFNSSGERLYYFEPGGSRYSVILGCAISKDGSHIGIVCGVEQQRFLLFERFGSAGGEYKIVYHEFLGNGFRRPVYILFVDDDRRVVFERDGGIGCYTIKSRRGIFIPLDGNIVAVDGSGDQGVLFLITSHPGQEKKLTGIQFPREGLFGFLGNTELVFLRALFKSDDVFLSRKSSTVVTGGGATLISFSLEEK